MSVEETLKVMESKNLKRAPVVDEQVRNTIFKSIHFERANVLEL